VEAAVLHTDVGAVSDDKEELRIYAIGRWPGWAGVWAGEELDAPSERLGRTFETRRAALGGVVFESGQVFVYTGPYGTTEWRAVHTPEHFFSGWSNTRLFRPLPYWVVFSIPHWLGMSFFAVAPLLWLALHSSHSVILRRRRRLGRCLRCGYDLTGNMSRKCSECGQAVYCQVLK